MARPPALGLTASLQAHWQEYLSEAALLGAFMISACAFSVLLQHPASALRMALPAAWMRRALGGIAMGITAICLIYSAPGRRSGAHFNPAVTLTFFRLKKIAASDAFFYILAQFIGGASGVALAALILGRSISHPAVRYAVTVPGATGIFIAALAEFVISFGLMSAVLLISNSAYARFTGMAAGTLVAIYITLEAPFSGMSMNPARTFASALAAHTWTGWWIYFLVPPLAMFTAAQFYIWRKSLEAVVCAKLYHDPKQRCIFCGADGAPHDR